MRRKKSNFSEDFENSNRPEKIDKIRRKLSEILEVPSYRVVQKETDELFQKTGYGDYIVIKKSKEATYFIYVEWKSNSFDNWGGYKYTKKVLFEIQSDTNKNECGPNLLSTHADLWAHSFWNKDDNEIVEVLVYEVESLREYLSPRKHLYKIITNHNHRGDREWKTISILVPSREIKKFLVTHFKKYQ